MRRPRRRSPISPPASEGPDHACRATIAATSSGGRPTRRTTFEAVASFALQLALTALLTPAAAAIFRGAESAAAVARTVKYLRSILVNTVSTVAANAAVHDAYGAAETLARPPRRPGQRFAPAP